MDSKEAMHTGQGRRGAGMYLTGKPQGHEKQDKSPLYGSRPKSPKAPKEKIPSLPDLTDAERAIETQAKRRVLQDYPALRDEYLTENATFAPDESISSVLVNTDEWRHLFHGYVGTNAHAVRQTGVLRQQETARGAG